MQLINTQLSVGLLTASNNRFETALHELMAYELFHIGIFGRFSLGLTVTL
jgi:hypothetical protein